MKYVVILCSALALILGCMPPSGGGTKNRDEADPGGRTGGVTPLGNTTNNNGNSMTGNGGTLGSLCDQACDRLVTCGILEDHSGCVMGCMSDDASEMIALCVIRTDCGDLLEVCLGAVDQGSDGEASAGE